MTQDNEKDLRNESPNNEGPDNSAGIENVSNSDENEASPVEENEKTEVVAEREETESRSDEVSSEPQDTTEEKAVEAKEDEKTVEAAETTSSDETTEETVEPEPVEAKEEKASTSEDTANEDDDDDDEEDDDEENPSDTRDEKRVILPELDGLTAEELLELALNTYKNEEVQYLKRPIEKIRQAFFGLLKNEFTEKQEEFVAEGGNAIDFQYDQPIKRKFQDFYDEFRNKLRKYYSDLEQRLNENLRKREAIIKAIDDLTFSEETDEVTTEKFRALRDEWKTIGPVPKAKSSEVYRSYHFHLEKYFDNRVRLNREFREMEFQKNLEQKEELIRKAEELLTWSSIKSAFNELQNLHKIWKEETGPVSREKREDVWDRFSEATKKFHDKRQEHFNKLREKREQNLLEKEAVLAKLSEKTEEIHDNHNDWQKAMEEVKAINGEFRKIGRVPNEDNDRIWETYLSYNRRFNRAKNNYYKAIKNEYRENMDQRMKFIEEAESLMESTNWKETANRLKKLQADWRKIGPVPPSQNRKTWNRFTKACNTFFERRKADMAEKDKAFEGNYTAKEKMMDEVEKWTPSGDRKADIDQLKSFMKSFREIGRVPFDKKGINQSFSKLVDSKFAELKVNKAQRRNLEFNSKVEALAEKGEVRSIEREERDIRRSIKDTEAELRQLEGNMQMFTNSAGGNNPLLKMAQKNVDNKQKELDALKTRLLHVIELRNKAKNESDESDSETTPETTED